jgi:hypothetical protein
MTKGECQLLEGREVVKQPETLVLTCPADRQAGGSWSRVAAILAGFFLS